MRRPYENELWHYGIQGQKWGIRRFQNPDGTLTSEGKARYGNLETSSKMPHRSLRIEKKFAKQEKKALKKSNKFGKRADKAYTNNKIRKFTKNIDKKYSADVVLNRLSAMADKYYSSSREDQIKMNRGRSAVSNAIRQAEKARIVVGLIPNDDLKALEYASKLN